LSGSVPTTGRSAPVSDLRVFISSPFRGMAEERDRLVRRVFPELRRRCLTYQLSLCEIDLRWGITEEAALRGDVLRLCLAEIDRCFPFFIGMLGEHYGWVDPEAAYHLETLAPHLVPYADRSVTELEIRHAVLNRRGTEPPICFFYFRAEGRQTSPPQTEEAQKRLAELKREIVRAGHAVRSGYADADALGEQVLEDVWSAIIARAGTVPSERTWRSLLTPRVLGFLERPKTIRRVEDALARQLPVLLHGEPGAGKTTLMSHWIRERIGGAEAASLHLRPSWRCRLCSWLARKEVVQQVTVVLFFPASVESVMWKSDQSWALLAVTILEQVRELARIEEPIPTAIAALPGTLGRWLAIAARVQPIVLVLDGLEEVLGAGAALDWLPQELPTGVTLFLSAASEKFTARLGQRGWQWIHLRSLSRREREALTRQYLAAYGKRLSAAQQRAVLALQPAGNPLYLRTLLDQMRETGRFETLSEQLAEFREVEGLTSLLERAFASIEEGMDRDWPPGGLVGRALALLAASRAGLAEVELRELLGDRIGRLPDRIWSPLHLMLEPYLVRVGGTLRFSGQNVRAAAERRFADLTATLSVTRRTLVLYYLRDPASPRALEELPWLLAALGEWDALADLIGRRDVLIALVADRPFDATSLWTALATQSRHRPEQVYAAVFAAPVNDPALALAVARLMGDIGEVEAALRVLEALAGPKEGEAAATAIQSQISVLLELRRFADAAPLAERQVALCKVGGLRRNLGAALDNLALVRIEQGRVHEALALQSSAEALHRKYGRDRALAVSLGIGATALLRCGREAEALERWRAQETQSRLVGDLRCLAASLGNQAVLLAGKGQVDPADRLSLDQERLCRQINDRYGLQTALATRANILAAHDRFDEALDALSERYALAEGIGDAAGEAAALLQRAEVFLRMRDPRSATTLLARVEAKLSDHEWPADIRAQFTGLRENLRAHGRTASDPDQPSLGGRP
jgi:tetratricopeptide (TPR) repeat protein